MSIEKYVVTFFSWSNKNFALEKLSLLKVKSSYPTHPTDSYVTYFSKNFISTVGFTRLYLLMAKQWSPKLSSLTFKSTHTTHPTHPIHPTDSYVTYFSRSFITTLGFTRLYLLVVVPWSAKYVDQSSFNSKSINWLATEKKQTVHHHYSGSSLLDSNLTMPVTFKLCYVFSRQS